MIRTSETDPIQVHFLPIAAKGKLGLTFAPGKKAPGIAGTWDRSLEADLTRIVSTYGANHLVCLLEGHEFGRLDIRDLPRQAWLMGLTYLHFPITDAGVPSETGIALLTERIHALVGRGDVVVAHCRGGLGRAGLVGACSLVRAGTDPEEAMSITRTARLGAIENSRQEEFIRAFSRHLRASSS